MAAARTFHCTVVTPERAVLDCEAEFVALPAWDGEIGILKHRAPLLCKLGIGALRVHTPSRQHLLFLDGGFAEMADDRLTILTEVALRPEELEREQVEERFEAARALPVRDDASYRARQRALQRARAQRKLLRQ